MINTYNESDLHEKLKAIYALEFDGECEKKIEGTKWIADVLLKDGDVIEIQTGNVSALKEKIAYLLKNNKKVKVVRPILIVKFIEMYEESIEESKKELTKKAIRESTEKIKKYVYRKKSPKRETVYSILRGLTGICEFLTDENFELEIVLVKSVEKRQKANEKVQLKNKSRRHLKDWIPLGKTLESIEGKMKFKSKDDYKKLIPLTVPQKFTNKELQEGIFNKDFGYELTTANRKEAASWSKLLIWILEKMNIIEEIGKRGRAKEYGIIKN